MKTLHAAAVSALFLASTLPAVQAQTPLAVGKPAGVQNASMSGNGLLIALGIGVAIAATVEILSADNNNKGVTGTTTTATSTTGTSS